MLYIRKLFQRHKLLMSINIIYFFIILSSMALTWLIRTEFAIEHNSQMVIRAPWNEIFIQNVSVSFLMIVLGIFSFGIISIFIGVYNLYTFAVTIDHAYNISESYLYTFSIIMTHGIVEIPAIAISLYISTLSLRYLFNYTYRKEMFRIQSVNSFFKIILVITLMLLVGSFIEAYVTPKIVEIVM